MNGGVFAGAAGVQGNCDMPSLRRHEGYLLIDNRGGPGIGEEFLHAVMPDLPAGCGRGVFEAPTITCSHCHAVVVLNPNRQRERPYCRKCDHYICDACGALAAMNGGECRTFNQILDEVQECAAVAEQRCPIILSA
jgi:hypothetical protein